MIVGRRMGLDPGLGSAPAPDRERNDLDEIRVVVVMCKCGCATPGGTQPRSLAPFIRVVFLGGGSRLIATVQCPGRTGIQCNGGRLVL
jgi:hypothetical protein